jgi:hypothetical protein
VTSIIDVIERIKQSRTITNEVRPLNQKIDSEPDLVEYDEADFKYEALLKTGTRFLVHGKPNVIVSAELNFSMTATLCSV